MSTDAVPPVSSDASLEAYEKLRSGALAGSSTGGNREQACEHRPSFGLVLLLREGVAAWMVRRSAGPAHVEPATNPDRRATALLMPDETKVSIVHVLVNMALCGRKEMNA